MNTSERRQVAKALRAAASLLMAADMKLLKIVDAIGKGRKIGTYDPVEIVEALQLIDPEWSIEGTYGVITAHSFGDHTDYVKDKLKAGVPPDTYVGAALTKKEPFDFSPPHGNRSEATAQALLPYVKKLMTKAPKKGPPQAEKDKIYYSGAMTVDDPWGDGGAWGVHVHGVMLGVPVWRITAPGGQVLDLPVVPDSRGRYEERAMKKPTLWTWLFKKVPGVKEAARELVESSGLEQKKAKQRMLKRGQPGDFGTCAVCDRIQKIRRNKMVLHGYQRPGYGYIIGNCLGVGYAPYELSPEGCKHAASIYGTTVKQLDSEILAMPRQTALRVKDSYGGYIVKPDDTVEQLPRHSKEIKGITAWVRNWQDDPWKAAVEANREVLRKAKKQFESERDRMILKIKEWEPQPLPGMK